MRSLHRSHTCSLAPMGTCPQHSSTSEVHPPTVVQCIARTSTLAPSPSPPRSNLCYHHHHRLYHHHHHNHRHHRPATLRAPYRGSWKRMFLEHPHLRFEGLYVARNTYLRAGAVEMRNTRSVHIVSYFRFFRWVAVEGGKRAVRGGKGRGRRCSLHLAYCRCRAAAGSWGGLQVPCLCSMMPQALQVGGHPRWAP